MKNLLISALKLGLITGAANAALAYFLGNSILETPFQPGTTEFVPVAQFAIMAGVFTLLLIVVGAVILGLLKKRMPEKGIRIWTIIAVVFLILYGIFPFIAPEAASTDAAILTNILHLVAGIPAIIFLPKNA